MEIHTVAGFTYRCRSHRRQRGNSHAFGQSCKAADRRERAHATFWIEDARLRQPSTQSAHDFLVIEIGGRARCAIKHNQAHRVGADVDYANAAQPHGGRVLKQGPPKAAPIDGIVVFSRHDGTLSHRSVSVVERQKPPPSHAQTVTDFP